jgi:CheY-like chemotaxis protein
MPIPLRLLILEDQAQEAELMIAQLCRSGLDPHWKRVDNETDFRAGVLEDWDIILADFALPQFSALQALQILQEVGAPIPLIVVTGAVGEEVAVECIKQGAADYLLKDRLTRLPSAITQALEQKRMRQESELAHRALQENEERFRTLVECSSNGMLLLNGSGKVLYRYNDLFPSRRDDNWYRDNFLEWMIAGDRPAVRLMWNRLEEGIQTAQFRISNDHGAVCWLEAVCNDLRARQHVGAIVVHYRDITERHELEEQFRHAQKMQAVGQLAAGLGHDLNNLLTIISGYSNLLIKHPGLPAPVQKGLSEIEEACRRSARLTRDLLTFSRKHVRDAKVLDANRVISGLLPLLRSLFREDLDLRSNLQDGLCLVQVEEGELDQVIMNLVVNARDATAGSGSITIETRTIGPFDPLLRAHGIGIAGPHILFSVSDTGSGMAPETQARIFEPFFTTKEVGKGIGLGLSTVYAIVNTAGGRVLVESDLGKGSTFRLLLPQADSLPAADTPACPPIAHVAAHETILVVEDDDSLRELIVDILAPLGYQLLTASTAAEALECWRSATTPIQLLLTDVRMPGQKGPQLAHQLRKEQPALHVLFISGCADAEDQRCGLPDASLLSKPFYPDMLVKKVRGVLDSPGTRGPSVLIVDDDAQILNLLRAVLEGEGYRVEATRDGKQALALVTNACPDIVITDLVMPGMEGIELIRRMRKSAADLKIVAMSGAPDRTHYLHGARFLGADATVGKPLVIDLLLQKVRDLLASKGPKKLERPA